MPLSSCSLICLNVLFSVFNLLSAISYLELNFFVLRKHWQFILSLICVSFLQHFKSNFYFLSHFRRLVNVLNLDRVFNKLLRAIRHDLSWLEFINHRIWLLGWHAPHVSILHMVNWLVHHKLALTRNNLRELLITVLRLRSSVVLPHLLVQKVWIHEHLLVWESHLVWHHHICWELTNLPHVYVHWRRHTLRISHLGTIIPIWSSLFVGIALAYVLSKFSLTMGIRTFITIFTMSI